MFRDRLPKYFWFAYAVALTTWTICIYCELGRIYRDHELFAKNVEGHTYVSDFAVFYNAARLTRIHCTERKLNVYDAHEQEMGLREVTAPVVAERPLLAIYPPYFFALVMPLSLLSLDGAWFAWCALGAVSLLLTLWFSVQTDRLKSAFSRYFIFAAVLASYPVWLSFKLGQVALFLPAGMALFWFLLRRNKFLLSGLVSVLCILKVQYLPILGAAGLVRGRLKYVLGAGVTLLVLLLVSYLMLGWDNMISFPAAVRYNETAHEAGGVSPHMMQNFRGMLTLLVGDDNGFVHILSMSIFAASFGIVAAIWWRLGQAFSAGISKVGSDAPPSTNEAGAIEARAFSLAASATIIIVLICSPHTHIQDYAALVPAAIWLWCCTAGDATRAAVWIRRLLLLFPFLSWFFFMTQPLWMIIRMQPFFIWAAMLLVPTGILLKKEFGNKAPQST